MNLHNDSLSALLRNVFCTSTCVHVAFIPEASEADTDAVQELLHNAVRH